MIIISKARQRQYKTTTIMAAALHLVLFEGYSTSEIVSNIHLFKPRPKNDDLVIPVNYPDELKNHCLRNDVVELTDYHYLTNPQMRLYVKKMVQCGLRHKIIIIDEIDRVFPHRFWHDREQTETLLGLWQDEKLFNYILASCHLGLAVDSTIRESTQVEVIPEVVIKGKQVDLTVLNALDMEIFQQSLENIELVQKLFCSWEVLDRIETKEVVTNGR